MRAYPYDPTQTWVHATETDAHGCRPYIANRAAEPQNAMLTDRGAPCSQGIGPISTTCLQPWHSRRSQPCPAKPTAADARFGLQLWFEADSSLQMAKSALTLIRTSRSDTETLVYGDHVRPRILIVCSRLVSGRTSNKSDSQKLAGLGPTTIGPVEWSANSRSASGRSRPINVNGPLAMNDRYQG